MSPRVAKAPHPPLSGTRGPRRTAFSPTQPFPPSKMEDILQKVEAGEEWGMGGKLRQILPEDPEHKWWLWLLALVLPGCLCLQNPCLHVVI